jgi:hypothetical protein
MWRHAGQACQPNQSQTRNKRILVFVLLGGTGATHNSSFQIFWCHHHAYHESAELRQHMLVVVDYECADFLAFLHNIAIPLKLLAKILEF